MLTVLFLPFLFCFSLHLAFVNIHSDKIFCLRHIIAFLARFVSLSAQVDLAHLLASRNQELRALTAEVRQAVLSAHIRTSVFFKPNF